jgi:hypothetical protein
MDDYIYGASRVKIVNKIWLSLAGKYMKILTRKEQRKKIPR